jgi:hypothetical protein
MSNADSESPKQMDTRNKDVSLLTDYLRKHFSSRIELELLISRLISANGLDNDGSYNKLIELNTEHMLKINEFITDYVTSCNFAIFPAIEQIAPQVLEALNEADRNIAIGISFLTNIVARDPTKTSFSILLSLYSDWIALENELFPQLANTSRKTALPHTFNAPSLLKPVPAPQKHKIGPTHH